MTALVSMPDGDPAHFLKIAGQGAALVTHADLWRWLQGDVQSWLAHDIMLIGWGDFRSGELHFDIVSSLPGLRPQNCEAARISRLLGYFRDCWVAAQQSPCQLVISDCIGLLGDSLPGCAFSQAITTMQTALVHGIGDGRHCGQRMFVTFSEQARLPAGADVALRLLLPFIDTALRRMPPAPTSLGRFERKQVETLMGNLTNLSERERQIMVWVAMGKTNPEIGCILCISEFTVKNHMKSIFAKLDVTNRAQAVAKLTRMDSYA